jgi:leucyl-tRNA synthetase
MKRYDPKQLEPKWQKIWDETKLYEAKDNDPRPKWYQLEFFPYPSGVTMHVGHVRNYVISDTFARYKRMTGHNVLHPMGWDAFGLPAENHAIKTGTPPRQSTEENIKVFKRQLRQVGLSYDWSREINSSEPDYYRWTQWLFLLFYKRGLAYKDKALVNWCPHDKTVLANEQVIKKDGMNVCERCGHEVEKRELAQWFFKITDYADRLLEDLNELDWPESVKAMQRNWIGRSVGALIEFEVGEKESDAPVDSLKFTPELTKLILDNKKTTSIRLEPKNLKVGDRAKLITRHDSKTIQPFATATISKIEKMALKDIPLDLERHEHYRSRDDMVAAFQSYYGNSVTLDSELTIYSLSDIRTLVEVFTTRIDTLYSGTFIVLAPEHELVARITTPNQKSEVESYVKQALSRTEIERMGEGEKAKTGVFTGAYAINPANKEKMPIWVGDFVLGGYGTGAIFGDGHDERDVEFAKRYDIPLKTSIQPISIDTVNPPKEGAKNTTRNVTMCVVHNPRDDTYLTLKWKKFPWHTFITGGIEGDEQVTEAAAREITEETGYKNLKFKREMPFSINSRFYAAHKDVNRDITMHVLEFELVNDEMVSTKLESHEDFDVAWVRRKELDRLSPLTELGFVLRWLDEGDFVYTGEGRLIDSGSYTGMESPEAREKMTQELGREQINYKMRDWLISRQRYWGAPIPVVYCKKDGIVPVPEDQLPVELPHLEVYQPSDDGRSPLARAEGWLHTTCPKCGGPAERETDTMDTFVDSSWYFLRFADPHNDDAPFAREKVDYWLPVDTYVGGVEHAVMHLLFARFWTKVLQDEGMIDFAEPFTRLRNQGMIGAADGRKMGKRYGNAVTPDDVIDQGYGADSLRLYEMFIGPYDQGVDWNPNGIDGTKRFLNRVWALVQDHLEAPSSDPDSTHEALEAALASTVHKTLKKVTVDLEHFAFNTAIASMMECVNELYKLKTKLPLGGEAWRDNLRLLVQMLAPFAPHLAEELWQELGGEGSVHASGWPTFDPELVREELMTIVLQVNGKVRAQLEVVADASEEEVLRLAKDHESFKRHTEGQEIAKTIYVPGKLVSFVVK